MASGRYLPLAIKVIYNYSMEITRLNLMVNEYVKRKSRLRYLKKQNANYAKDFINIEMKLIEKSEKKIIKNYGISMLEDLKQLVRLHGYCLIRE